MRTVGKTPTRRALWCDRTLLQAQYVGLCLTEKQFKRELKTMNVPPRDWPVFPVGFASTTFLENAKLGRIAIVCISPMPDKTREQHYALLVHEAMHIWRSELRYINEQCPGDEIEAYAVQNIAQGLMIAYREMVG